MDMVVLNNGTTAPQPAVIATFLSLRGLWRGGLDDMCAVIDLVERCRNPQYPIEQGSEAKLRRLALIDSNGKIHEIVRNVALSAAEGKGSTMTLVSPLKPSAGDLALKEKVEKTIDSLLGVHMAMLQLATILSREQIEAFCDNTRNGSDLWDDFIVARDASDNEQFGFSDYARQVLSTTPYPMS